MVRRFAFVAAVGALTAGSSLVGRTGLVVTAAAPAGVVCAITGTANLTPGVTTTPKPTTYTFTGTLKSCVSTDKTVKTGSVSASGAGSLGCAEGTSKGTATVQWNNGQTTSLTFSTVDVASAVVVSGHAASGEFSGDAVAGGLNFITTAAASCLKGGLTTLNFTGAVATG